MKIADSSIPDMEKHNRILFDNETQFTSTIWISDHPKSNPVERVVRKVGQVCSADIFLISLPTTVRIHEPEAVFWHEALR